LNRAVRAPPIWRNPVGDGAKRVLIVSFVIFTHLPLFPRPSLIDGFVKSPNTALKLHPPTAFAGAGLLRRTAKDVSLPGFMLADSSNSRAFPAAISQNRRGVL
jgi:hypothetical protein